MARHLLVGDGEGDSLPRLRFYDICKLHKDTKTEEEDMSCGMSAILRINLMDMTLPICHRVTYPQFRGGTFEIKENHIIGIIPSDGLSGYLQLKTLSPKFFIKCNKCKYRPFCLQGCFGAQYEYSGEILSPIPAVCNLQKAKIDTLLELYNTYGIIQEGIESNLFDDEEFKRQIIKLSIEKGYFNG